MPVSFIWFMFIVMKKAYFILWAALLLLGVTAKGQCVINAANTTPGITAVNATDTLYQGIAYQQSFQIYIPAYYQGAVIDSVQITVTGAPAGLTAIYEPGNGTGATITGGGNGVICLVGVSYDTARAYPLTFSGTVYTGTATAPLANLPVNLSYTFYVQPPPPLGWLCDTSVNVNLQFDDTLILPLPAPNKGYLSGNGAVYTTQGYYPFLAVAEKLTGGIGDSVTGAFVQFGRVTINPADSAKPIGFYVYNDFGPLASGAHTGGPGTAIDSAFLSLSAIAADVQHGVFSIVSFNHGAVLTAPGFFIVVQFPLTTGDTLVIYTNDATSANGEGYLKITAWYAYSQALGLSADSLGNYIGATLCGPNPFAPRPGFDATPMSLCSGTTVHFNNVTLGSPTSFLWNFGDSTATSIIEDPVHTYYTPGKYLVSLTAANAGGSAVKYAYVTVYANPTATDSVINATGLTVADGAAFIKVTSGTKPYTLLWSAGTEGDSLPGIAPGTYEVTVTDSNSCYVIDTVIVSYSNSINNITGNVQIKIYPNPANDVLNFVWNVNQVAELNVYDLTGTLVKTYICNGNPLNQLDIRKLIPGTYMVRITDKENNTQHAVLFSKL